MNKKEAARYLGVSVRSLLRYTAAGKLSPKYLPGRTGPAPDYDRAQLDELKRQMSEPRPAARDAGQALTTSRGRVGLEQLVGAFAEAMQKALPPAPARPAGLTPDQLSHKLLYSVAEARVLTGLSEGAILEAIADGRLKGEKVKGRRGYTIKRRDLEKFAEKVF